MSEDSDEREIDGLALYNRQSVEKLSDEDLDRLLCTAAKAREALLGLKPDGVLAALEEIELTVVDDPAIARVHNEFFADPNATDVITFEHGEILISSETARRQSKKFDMEFLPELTLYAIHGLAHLAGFDDKDPADREEMTAVQEELLKRFW